MTRLTPILFTAWTLTAASSPAFAQSQADTKQSPAELKAGLGQTTSKGTVVSVTRTTLVIRTDEGQYQIFEQDADTTRPTNLPQRASVAVIAKPGDAAGDAPIATMVMVTALPPAAAAAPVGGAPAAPEIEEPVPAQVRRLESDIKRQTRRYHVGVRAGSVLDPELVMIGAQAQLGPFFTDNIWARPNLEFGWGEVTDTVGLNLDGLYRVPITLKTGRWQMFFGGGPAFNISKLGFSTPNNGDNVNNGNNGDIVNGGDNNQNINFDEWTFDIGLNFIVGVQSRNGLFFEMKTTAYSSPHLRLLFGYNF